MCQYTALTQDLQRSHRSYQRCSGSRETTELAFATQHLPNHSRLCPTVPKSTSQNVQSQLRANTWVVTSRDGPSHFLIMTVAPRVCCPSSGRVWTQHSLSSQMPRVCWPCVRNAFTWAWHEPNSCQLQLPTQWSACPATLCHWVKKKKRKFVSIAITSSAASLSPILNWPQKTQCSRARKEAFGTFDLCKIPMLPKRDLQNLYPKC